MARKPRSVSDIDAEIEALKKQRKEALEAQSAHIGRLAAKAGLTGLDISDAELVKEFEAVAARFQNKASPPSPKTA